jgi:hypothetical protein
LLKARAAQAGEPVLLEGALPRPVLLLGLAGLPSTRSPRSADSTAWPDDRVLYGSPPEEGVSSEPVSEAKFPASSELTGIFPVFGRKWSHLRPNTGKIQQCPRHP